MFTITSKSVDVIFGLLFHVVKKQKNTVDLIKSLGGSWTIWSSASLSTDKIENTVIICSDKCQYVRYVDYFLPFYIGPIHIKYNKYYDPIRMGCRLMCGQNIFNLFILYVESEWTQSSVSEQDMYWTCMTRNPIKRHASYEYRFLSVFHPLLCRSLALFLSLFLAFFPSHCMYTYNCASDK